MSTEVSEKNIRKLHELHDKYMELWRFIDESWSEDLDILNVEFGRILYEIEKVDY